MTSRENMRAVWKVYPEADCVELPNTRGSGYVYGILNKARNSAAELSELQPTEAEAWDDAASKLPSAPSPAGEAASEHVVEVYGTFAGPNQPAVFFEGKCSCGATWRTITEVWICPKSLPEPVSTEGAAEEGDWFPYPVAAPIAPAAVSDGLAWEVASRIVGKFPQIEQAVLAPLLKREIRMAFTAFADEYERRLAAKPSAEGDGWIAEPSEQGWWWHIDAGEHTDMIPFMYGIMLSGTNGKMFIQYPDSRWCSDVGGLWARATPPPLPAPPSGQGEKR